MVHKILSNTPHMCPIRCKKSTHMLHKLQFETLLLLRVKFRHDKASNGEEGGGDCRLDIGVEKELEKVGVLKGE